MNRPSVPLQSHSSQRLGVRRNYPGAQEAADVADCLKSRRGPAVFELRAEHQAPHYPDDLLRCRVAHFRGYQPESKRCR
jgi:hypothetical protein